MPKAYRTWTVLPHGRVETVDDNLWRVEGSLPGLPLRRVMTIARRDDGDLVILNAIALDEPAMKQIEALGRVAYIVVPNGWHRLDAAVFAARYPEAAVIAPSGSLAKVADVVARARPLHDFAADGSVSLEAVEGSRDREALMTIRTEGRVSLAFTDAVFNMPHVDGAKGFVFRHVLKSSGGPRVSRLGRYFILRDRAAFAAQLERLATPALARVLVAHHETITERPADVLRRVAATLR